MGIWGTGIYSNDMGEDVREMCNEIFPYVSVEYGNSIIFNEFSEVINGKTDNEYMNFWCALADWQWKHGILIEEVKKTTINLLKSYTGINEWKETSNAADVKKRMAAMDKLLTQLNEPQPKIKIPKPNLKKPKHKTGEIIIFKTCSSYEDIDGFYWKIEYGPCNPCVFKEDYVSKQNSQLIPHVSVHDKYMAMLCVGTQKIKHSQYLLDIYDEVSVYVLYDFLSDSKPSLHDLEKCGFLPTIDHKYDLINGGIITKHIEWVYKFIFPDDSFIPKRQNGIVAMEKSQTKTELERFELLYKRKNYSQNVYDSMLTAISDIFGIKNFFERIGIKIDNLMCENCSNPKFADFSEIDLRFMYN